MHLFPTQDGAERLQQAIDALIDVKIEIALKVPDASDDLDHCQTEVWEAIKALEIVA